MQNELVKKEFEKIVNNKFNVYNSLFLNLPYPKVSHIGMLIPLLNENCKNGLETGKEPIDIIDTFFDTHTKIKSEEEKIDFMFRVIQYIERQIVLYDSVEDSAYKNLIALQNNLSFQDYIHIAENKNSIEKLINKLSSFSTRIVFTAHPTQFYSHSVLEIINKLRQFISENNINGIDLSLQQLGLTSLINSKKPTPFDEAKNVIYFLSSVYYDAAAELYANIKQNIPNKNFDNPNIIQFGFWPGGDRDGNPYVTSEITLAVADELRMTLMSCYYNDLKNLKPKLTFREIEENLDELINKVYSAMINNEKLLKYEEILEALLKIKETVISNYNSLYLENVENIINKVKIFKTHFASLDIRQNHQVHKETIEDILKNEKLINNSIDELERNALIKILIDTELKISADQFDNELVKDTILTISQINLIQKKNGEDGSNRYIISNSEDIFSVLFVYALLRWCHWQNNEIPIDIIPLFESIEGMSNSKLIMQELFEIPQYRKHIKYRNNIQTIMLGFSDGTKDGGYLQANWSIFKTKENLTSICRKYNIEPIFFDGRGGPPARGGGKTHRFYASQSEKIANNAIQITIQGQTISSKFGTKDHFIHNSEMLLTAGISNSIFEKENSISQESRQIIERLSEISYNKYNSLKKHKMFIPYLENKSTLKYYGDTRIGSRPTKRGSSKNLELNDLRAIPFVGSWSQLKQNVPGYYGVGTAIKTLVDEGKSEDLKKLFNEVPFFKALILNSMMSLKKCNFDLTKYIEKDQEYNEFWNVLLSEYELAKEMVLFISGYNILMEEEPVSRSSIEIRENIVLPLLIIQQTALQKIELDSQFKSNYEKMVRRSLYGNINASRNSA
ncbi:MAG: phosphoenolpyruvate carboxylase [Ignavibacteriales bacterium]|nr:phosphoenolpyruvate carboxylase [Ignavibacteriales bacterium]